MPDLHLASIAAMDCGSSPQCPLSHIAFAAARSYAAIANPVSRHFFTFFKE